MHTIFACQVDNLPAAGEKRDVRDELRAAKARLQKLGEKVQLVAQLQSHMVEQDVLVQKLHMQLAEMRPSEEVRVLGCAFLGASTQAALPGIAQHTRMTALWSSPAASRSIISKLTLTLAKHGAVRTHARPSTACVQPKV